MHIFDQEFFPVAFCKNTNNGPQIRYTSKTSRVLIISEGEHDKPRAASMFGLLALSSPGDMSTAGEEFLQLLV